jgi:hypothetical protein
MREGAAMRQAATAGGGGGGGAGAEASAGGAGAAASRRPVEAVVLQFAGDHLLLYNGAMVHGYAMRPAVSGRALRSGAMHPCWGSAEVIGNGRLLRPPAR